MSAPATCLLPKRRVPSCCSSACVVQGGQNANKTSIYQLASNKWLQGPDMHISRGYASSVTLSDGKVRTSNRSPSFQRRFCRISPSACTYKFQSTMRHLRHLLGKCRYGHQLCTVPSGKCFVRFVFWKRVDWSAAEVDTVQVFVLGGSWSGPTDLDKDAEVYDPTRGTWTLLPGIQAATILTDDPEDAQEGRVYRADNYGFFHAWSDATGTFPPGFARPACMHPG